MSHVGLLDCNNFFVSCERVFRPDLAKKPVVVLSSNDGCIVSRSKEVKAAGIPMGIPYFKAKRELDALGAHVFSSNFPLYRDMSARVMDVLAREVGFVEQYSVDEAFFTLTEERAASLLERALNIRSTVEREVGIPVTVGIAKTKTIAKCATEVGKRGNGVALLAGKAWREVAAVFPLADVWGIGGKTTMRLKAEGLLTVADFLFADPARIRDIFGVHGSRLRLELNEQRAEHAHASDELQQSIMSTRSFQKSSNDLAVLTDAIAYHIAHAAEELRTLGALAQTLRVIVRPSRHGDWAFRGGTREALLLAPTDDTRVLLREARVLLKRMYESGVPYKKAGVVLTGIIPKHSVSLNVFEHAQQVTSEKLFSVVDALNKRFGSGTVGVGRTQQQSLWAPSRSHISPRYTTEWKEIASVVA